MDIRAGFEWFFKSYFTVEYVSAGSVILFLSVFSVIVICNFYFSGIAKISKSKKCMDEFFQVFNHVDITNLNRFKGKCIDCLPRKVKKAWDSFETSKINVRYSGMTVSLRASANQSGAIGLVISLIVYVICGIFLCISSYFNGFDNANAQVLVTLCMMFGGIGLLCIVCQMHFSYKANDRAVDDIAKYLVENVEIVTGFDYGVIKVQEIDDKVVEIVRKYAGSNPPDECLESIMRIITSIR